MYSQAVSISEMRPAFPSRIDRNPRPAAPQVIVIDASSRFIEATDGAHALLAEGSLLRCSFDRLAAASHSVGEQLSSAIALTLDNGHASAAFEDGHQRFDVDCFAVQPEVHGDTHIVIILKSARVEPHRHLQAVKAAFGLTQAESRVLEALYKGCSIPQAAHMLGVARSTARTHLQRIFDKTGVRRQGDLMRVVTGG